MRFSVRFAVLAATCAALTIPAITSAQAGVGSSITPYAGYLITGHLYDGPFGTSLSTSNAPVVGAQLGFPLASGVSLVGNLAYSSGDLDIGVPILGGISIGTNKMWMYDAGLELGGLTGKRTGLAPFVQGGIGGVTNDLRNALFSTRSTNLAYTAGLGIDAGISRSLALRVQAKDYIGRFDTKEAVGFGTDGKVTHSWALSAGVKLAF